MMHNVDLIRRYSQRKMRELKIYLSMLSPKEDTALAAMSGETGEQTIADISDYILERLGHPRQDVSAPKEHWKTRDKRLREEAKNGSAA